MTPREAGAVLQRLQASWPGIGADEVGASEWLAVLVELPPDVGSEIARRLIHGWTMGHAPKLGDWREVARSVLFYRDARRPAVEAPRPAPAVLAGGLAACRASLAGKARYETPERPGASVLRPGDATVGSLEYGQVYDEHGQPRPEHAGAVEVWKGGRWKVQ